MESLLANYPKSLQQNAVVEKEIRMLFDSRINNCTNSVNLLLRRYAFAAICDLDLELIKQVATTPYELWIRAQFESLSTSGVYDP